MMKSVMIALAAFIGLAAVSSASKLEVHIVPHTHDDVGWLKTVDQYFVGSNQSIQNAAVNYILNSVILELAEDPSRKFTYVEQAFFQRWWNQQTPAKRTQVQNLVKNGQLAFVNGGWCMHDEAALHYAAGIDQTTVGHRFLVEQFDYKPTIGWQIDPFGHSATQASLLSADAGFDALFFGRIAFDDHDKRMKDRTMEVVWRASRSGGSASQVLADIMQSGNYGPPAGFCFSIKCNDPPIQDDPTLEDYNLEERVNLFVNISLTHQMHGPPGSNVIMFPMGSDFMYDGATNWFTNLDKLIKHVNADGRISLKYSTPVEYIAAKNAEGLTFTVKEDDFFPYASDSHAYWTGYFTSRPALKGYVRTASGYLQAARHIESFAGAAAANSVLQPFEQDLGVTQHHDAVSGTSKQHVAYDYAKRIAKGEALADSVTTSLLAKTVAMNGATVPTLDRCHLLNVSICAVTQSADSVMVLLYNPGSQPVSQPIRLPLPEGVTAVQVSNSSNQEVHSSIIANTLPVPEQTGGSTKSVAFLADLPAVGFNTFFLSTKSEEGVEVAVPQPAVAPTVSNGHIQLSYDTDGRLLNITNLKESLSIRATQDWFWYNSSALFGQASGAYIFRPNNTFPYPVTTSDVAISVQTTPVVTVVTQTFAPWLVQETRLWTGQDDFEVEFHVGPIPIGDGLGKEIVSRWNTSIASNKLCFTDSNGREMQRREVNYRPTWDLNVTEPVAGNYYPVNAFAFINDTQAQFTVLTDRSQGGGSLGDGELEIMVHRRILHDDGRGVGEPLNETTAVTPYPNFRRLGKGLQIRATHTISLLPSATALSLVRPKADALFFRPVPFVGNLGTSDGPTYSKDHVTSASWLKSPLPVNVALLTMRRWNETGFLMRLSHQFSVDEPPPLSNPASVDVSTLFSTLTISSMTELTLTANQAQADQHRMTWKTDNPVAPPPHREPITGMTVPLQPMEIRTFFLEAEVSA